MKLRILSWTVRGVNDKVKRMFIKTLIQAQKVDLVCFQETKVQDMSNKLVRSLGGGRYLGWKAINFRGAVSEILVFWDTRVLQLLEVEEGVFSCRTILKIAKKTLPSALRGCTGQRQR